MRHAKYTPGSLVLLRQLDDQDRVTAIWGGKVIATTPTELTVLAIEMVNQSEQWHCVGEFRTLHAPPHRLPSKWWFPRLLIPGEASDIDLKAKPVIEAALDVYQQDSGTTGKG
jgi:hypothetical protein